MAATYADTNNAFLSAGDLGNWVCIVVTVDVSDNTGGIHFYKDEIEQARTYGSSASTNILDPVDTFYISKLAWGTEYANGLIDNALVYDGIMDSETMANFCSCDLTDFTNVIAYWEHENDLTDTLGNNDLTNNNSITFQSGDLPFADDCSTGETETGTSVSTTSPDYVLITYYYEYYIWVLIAFFAFLIFLRFIYLLLP